MSSSKTRALLPPEDPPAQPTKPAATAAPINLDDEDEGYITQPPKPSASPPQQTSAAAADDDEEGYVVQKPPQQQQPPKPAATAAPINLDDEEEGYIKPQPANKPQQQQQPTATPTPAPAQTSSSTNAQQNPVKTKIPKERMWQTKMLYDEAVDTKECLFGFFCFQCAQASAKSDLDGSNVCYNCLCWHHGMTYSWLRSVYNINSNCGSDMMAAIFCSCCSGRRILSEVRIRKQDGQGIVNAEAEKPEWIESLFGCSGCGIAQAIFCSCCQAHEARMFLQNPDDLDCCFDVCCFNPCAAYGQVRNQYKIASTIVHPVFEDICVPFFCCPCALNRAVREARAYKNS